MSRPLKQLIYGAFYLAAIVLVGVALYRGGLRPAPTCSDRIQNQRETEVDCGGPNCTACAVLRLVPIRVEGAVKVFRTSADRVALLSAVVNPNESHSAARFSYRFKVYGSSGNLVETVVGYSRAAAASEKLLYEPRVATPFSRITKVVLEVSNEEWQPAGGTLTPALSSPQGVATQVEGDTIRVSGTVRNQGGVGTGEITVLAVVTNRFGDELFASQTVMPPVAAFGEGNFVVLFPADARLAEQVYPEGTKVFLDAR